MQNFPPLKKKKKFKVVQVLAVMAKLCRLKSVKRVGGSFGFMAMVPKYPIFSGARPEKLEHGS